MKTAIAPESGDPQRPYQHLQPIVDFLANRGNQLVTCETGFYPTQGGWVCDFKYPIDYSMIDAAFELPRSVRFSKRENAILCDLSWAEIRGNQGQS